MNQNERSEARRTATLQRQLELSQGREGPYYEFIAIGDAELMRQTESIGSWQLRMGMRTRNRLEKLVFEIDDNELLAGRLHWPSQSNEAEFNEAQKYLNQYQPAQGQTGHCELELEKLFELGLDGLISYIADFKANASGEKADTYESFIQALIGMSAMIEHAANCIENAMATADNNRKSELRDILTSCKRIVHESPMNFRDAIQLLWFAKLAVGEGDHPDHCITLGRLDQTLRPYYKPEEKQQSLELIEALYLLLNDRHSAGSAYTVMIGGQDGQGNDLTNDLSYLCMEAVRRTGLTYPTVGVCWYPGTPKELSNLTVELISKGYSTPAFFSDDLIARGLEYYGVPAEKTHDYINSTCVEITPRGCSNVWVASPYFSLCNILLDEINVNCDVPAETFEKFLEKYYIRLEQHIADAIKLQNDWRESRRKYGRKPLQSVFTRNCIARGLDIDNGGALYNWIECSFVGLANLIDSLVVIKGEVFGDKPMSFVELKKALDSNFDSSPNLYARITGGYSRYGHADVETDKLIPHLMNRIEKACAKGKMLPDNSHFIPGTFCWIMHQLLGSECGATPDGRLAGVAFADGCGPAQGRETFGPTCGIISVTSWDQHKLIGGAAYNMKFSKKLFDSSENRGKLQALIEAFLRQGGFETQINVVDQDTLLAARENPDAYRDLVVRIGGYTDYFTNLNPGMQEEVIRRTFFEDL